MRSKLIMKCIFFQLILLIFINTNAQDTSKALQLVKKYFNNELKNYKSVLEKEALEQDVNPDSVSKFNKEFEVMEEDESSAAISVTSFINDKDSISNIYIFLSKKDEWTIDAFRALSLPGFYFEFLDKYSGKDFLDLKSEYIKTVELARVKFDSIKSGKLNDSLSSMTDTLKFEDFLSKYTEKKFISMILSMRLALSCDEKLIEHFNKSKSLFEKLQYEISSDPTYDSEDWRVTDSSKYSDKFYELSIVQVYKNPCENYLRFLVGGVLDNSVGYLYCENPYDLPKLSKNSLLC